MHVVFLAHLARPADAEAAPLASRLGLTEYETRLALAVPPPAILLVTHDRDRAANAVAMIRSRGHGVHVFDDELFVPSERMGKLDDFRLDPDGVRRTADGDLLPFGDVFAILRAIHETVAENERSAARVQAKLIRAGKPPSSAIANRVEERENVAYFFRRSGERPWVLRERHASYIGLGPEREPIAFTNFVRTLGRIREVCPMAIYDDRLVRRRVAERVTADSALRSSRAGMDLLAHLLAMAIASQGGSPYR